MILHQVALRVFTSSHSRADQIQFLKSCHSTRQKLPSNPAQACKSRSLPRALLLHCCHSLTIPLLLEVWTYWHNYRGTTTAAKSTDDRLRTSILIRIPASGHERRGGRISKKPSERGVCSTDQVEGVAEIRPRCDLLLARFAPKTVILPADLVVVLYQIDHNPRRATVQITQAMQCNWSTRIQVRTAGCVAYFSFQRILSYQRPTACVIWPL